MNVLKKKIEASKTETSLAIEVFKDISSGLIGYKNKKGVFIPFNTGNGFIPLSGTVEGSPVSGDIKFVAGKGLICTNANEDGDNKALIGDSAFEVTITSVDVEDPLTFTMGNDGISSNKELFPTQSFDFTQKKYVNDVMSYSTTETLTGGTWIDGKPIYRKALSYNASDFSLLSGSINIASLVPSELENICFHYHKCTSDTDYKIEGNNLRDGFLTINNAMQVTGDNSLTVTYLNFSGAEIQISNSLYDNFELTIEYTKTTD